MVLCVMLPLVLLPGAPLAEVKTTFRNVFHENTSVSQSFVCGCDRVYTALIQLTVWGCYGVYSFCIMGTLAILLL